MAAPENKTSTAEGQVSNPIQLPKPDRGVAMSADLPARPQEVESQSKTRKSTKETSSPEMTIASQAIKDSPSDGQLKEKILKFKIDDISALATRSDEQRKAVINTVFAGQNPSQEVVSKADSLLKLVGNTVLVDQTVGGTLSQEALAKNLLSLVQQQRSFDCSFKELAMLDSLEFQLIRVLQQINPNIRAQQQQQIQEDNAIDDDAGGGGPEKVEDDRETSLDGAEESDYDSDLSYSPRSKKGRARARARDRKSRFKKWLERMMRAFRRQTMGMRGLQGQQNSARTQVRERRFVNTVRIFGRVIDAQNKRGIEGVKIVSNTLGSTVTGVDGSFAFENVSHGTAYSLAPVKSGFAFSPLSVNDIALDFREYKFEMYTG